MSGIRYPVMSITDNGLTEFIACVKRDDAELLSTHVCRIRNRRECYGGVCDKRIRRGQVTRLM